METTGYRSDTATEAESDIETRATSFRKKIPRVALAREKQIETVWVAGIATLIVVLNLIETQVNRWGLTICVAAIKARDMNFWSFERYDQIKLILFLTLVVAVSFAAGWFAKRRSQVAGIVAGNLLFYMSVFIEQMTHNALAWSPGALMPYWMEFWVVIAALTGTQIAIAGFVTRWKERSSSKLQLR